MGEIRSTLDLVLERTRHLSQTDEERRAQEEEESRRRIRGVLLRYEQGAMNREGALRALAAQSAQKRPDSSLVCAEILTRVGLQNDADHLLELLAAAVGGDPAGLRRVREACRAAIDEARGAWRQQAAAEWERVRGIRGSALVPNPGVDPAWHRRREEIRTRYARDLEAAKKHLTATPRNGGDREV